MAAGSKDKGAGHLGLHPKERALEGIAWYIKDRGLRAGDRLPSERELSEIVGVSRTALRAAIARMVSMHVLESRQGSGTYVLPPKPLNIFQETRNFTDAVLRVGRVPSSRLLSARVIGVSARVAAELGLPQDSRIFELRRVRMADSLPIGVETSLLNYSLCPGIESHDFSSESLYDVLADEYGVSVRHGVERVSIARASVEEARLLGLHPGDAVFSERAIERTEDNILVEGLCAVFVPSRYRFASSGSEYGEMARKVKGSWLSC